MEPEAGAADAAAPRPPVAADESGDAGPGPGSNGELATTSKAGNQKEDAPDVFDSPDFNVTAYVNRMFPTEASLVDLDPLISTLKQRIRRVDAEILREVRQQSSSGTRARGDLKEARATVEELFGRIREIERKAEQSELMVQEICRDIKKLDYAKKHLTATITAIRRLAMLLNAIDQLQLAVERHEYAEAAQLLEAVQQLASHFQSYAHIPKVAELKGRLASLEQSLRLGAMREFELLGEEQPSPPLLERLRACCLVVEALGYQARDELIDAVCRREMGVYTQIFATIGDTAKLERTVNRYKWLLKRLEARREVWAIFPPGWAVPQLLCLMFCNITRAQLAEVLDLRSGQLAHQVDALLKAVEATHIFEAEMARRFEGAPPSEREPSDGDEFAPGGDDTQASASRVRERYERLARERQRAAEDAHSPERRREQEHATSAAVARTNFKGSISGVFTPYLGVYVERVEHELMEALERMVREESWQPLSADLRVLRSSNELVEALKREMRDCVARVSRGRPLLDLAAAFGRVYRAYAARLGARLPRTAGGGAGGAAVLGATDWQVRLGEGDLALACLLVGTAEHCQEMVRQLARALAARLEPPELAGQLDLTDEEGEFQALITRCLGVLLLGVETRLEAGLAALMRVNWAALEAAGDQSEYVGLLRAALAEAGRDLAAGLPPVYLRFLLDKLLRSFAPRHLEAIHRARKISEAGCQQLRLDTEALKGALADMAREGGALDAAAQAGFAAEVQAQLGRAEAVLKVVGSPPEAMVDSFFELLPHGSPSDFQRLLELKVMSRQDFQKVQLQFNARMGRPVLAGGGGGGGGPGPGPSGAPAAGAMGGLARLTAGGGSGSFRVPPATAAAAAKASAAAQDMASRLRRSANVQAAARGAASASESVRESMKSSLAAMKSGLRFGGSSGQQQQQQQ